MSRSREFAGVHFEIDIYNFTSYKDVSLVQLFPEKKLIIQPCFVLTNRITEIVHVWMRYERKRIHYMFAMWDTQIPPSVGNIWASHSAGICVSHMATYNGFLYSSICWPTDVSKNVFVHIIDDFINTRKWKMMKILRRIFLYVKFSQNKVKKIHGKITDIHCTLIIWWKMTMQCQFGTSLCLERMSQDR